MSEKSFNDSMRSRGGSKTPKNLLYALTPPYESLKFGHPALTSYAAQKVRHQLSAEQRAAVDPEGGLHVFAPCKRTEPINMRLSWDTYGATTFEDVQAMLVKHQPLTFEYIQLLAIPERHNRQKEYRYRPSNFVRERSVPYVWLLNRWQVTTKVLCRINYAHNRNAKRLQVFNGILFLVNGAAKTVFDYSSWMCITPSYNNIFDTLKRLSEDEARKVKAIGGDCERGLDLTFDNVQAYAKQWEMRIGQENVMRVGMAGTAVELVGFDQQAVDLGKRRQLISEGRLKKMELKVDGLLTSLLARRFGAHLLASDSGAQPDHLHSGRSPSGGFPYILSKAAVLSSETINSAIGFDIDDLDGIPVPDRLALLCLALLWLARL